jgi:hypothetical protein
MSEFDFDVASEPRPVPRRNPPPPAPPPPAAGQEPKTEQGKPA